MVMGGVWTRAAGVTGMMNAGITVMRLAVVGVGLVTTYYSRSYYYLLSTILLVRNVTTVSSISSLIHGTQKLSINSYSLVLLFPYQQNSCLEVFFTTNLVNTPV